MKSQNRNFHRRNDNRHPFNQRPRQGWNGLHPQGPVRPPMPDRFSETEAHFLSLAAIDPHPRISLESGQSELTTRAMDLLTPVGKGQRGLIVSPPKTGKTTFLKHICQALTK